MKKESDELNHLFRTRLEDAQLQVRKGFWEELQQDIPMVMSHQRRMLITRISAAASVLLVLAGASAAFWYFSPKEEIAKAFTQVAVSTGTTPAPSALKPVAVTEEHDDDESFSLSFSMSFSYSSSSSSINQQHTDANNPTGNNIYAGGGDVQPSDTNTSRKATPAASSANDHKQRAWSVGALASVGMLNERVENPSPINYKRPLSLGLTVRKALSEDWGVESGLVYSRLTADQTLHYIGIPLKADYSLYNNNRTKLYAAAGGAIEKCVAGDVKPTPLQLSLSAALGVQYRLTDRLSLYAEPGLSYYFDDGSPVATIRKEKPLNVNVLCGVRLRID